MSMKEDIEVIAQYLPSSIYQDYKEDSIGTQTYFNDWVDSLNKDRVISDRTRENCYLSKSSTGWLYIYCGSYKRKIEVA